MTLLRDPLILSDTTVQAGNTSTLPRVAVFPGELWRVIIGLLPLRDKLTLRCVCQGLKMLTDDWTLILENEEDTIEIFEGVVRTEAFEALYRFPPPRELTGRPDPIVGWLWNACMAAFEKEQLDNPSFQRVLVILAQHGDRSALKLLQECFEKEVDSCLASREPASQRLRDLFQADLMRFIGVSKLENFLRQRTDLLPTDTAEEISQRFDELGNCDRSPHPDDDEMPPVYYENIAALLKLALPWLASNHQVPTVEQMKSTAYVSYLLGGPRFNLDFATKQSYLQNSLELVETMSQHKPPKLYILALAAAINRELKKIKMLELNKIKMLQPPGPRL